MSEGKGSGYEPSCYTECMVSTTYAADSMGGHEGRDVAEDHKITNYESEVHVFESVECF